MQISKKTTLNALALAGLGTGAASLSLTSASADTTQAMPNTDNASGGNTSTNTNGVPSQADVNNLNAQMRSMSDLANGLISLNGTKQNISAGDVKTIQDSTAQLQQLVTQYNQLVSDLRYQDHSNARVNGQVAFTQTSDISGKTIGEAVNNLQNLVTQMQQVKASNTAVINQNIQNTTDDNALNNMVRVANQKIASAVQNMINSNADIRSNLDKLSQAAKASTANNGVQVDTSNTDAVKNTQMTVTTNPQKINVTNRNDVDNATNQALSHLSGQDTGTNQPAQQSVSTYTDNGINNISDVNNWLNQQRQTIANTKTAQDQANTAVNTVRAYQTDALNKLNDMLQKAQAAGATSYQLKAIQGAITSVKNSNIYQTTNLGQLGQSNPYDFGNIGKGADEQNGSQDGSINNTKSTESTKLNNDAQSKLAQVTASNNTTLNKIKTALDNNVSNANKVYQEVLNNPTRTNVGVGVVNYNSTYDSNAKSSAADSVIQANQLSVQVNNGNNNLNGKQVSFAQIANASFQNSLNNGAEVDGIGSFTIHDGITSNSLQVSGQSVTSNRSDNNDLNALQGDAKNNSAVQNALNQGDSNSIQVISSTGNVTAKLPNSFVYRDDNGDVQTADSAVNVSAGDANLQNEVQAAVDKIQNDKYQAAVANQKQKPGSVQQQITQQLLLGYESHANVSYSLSNGSQIKDLGFVPVVAGIQLDHNGNGDPMTWKDAVLGNNESVAITYDNLDNSTYKGVKIGKIVRTLTVHTNGTMDVGIPSDPQQGFFYFNHSQDINKSVSASDALYDTNGNPINLQGNAYLLAGSLNTWQNHEEKIAVTNGQFIPIKESSVTMHSDGYAYSDINNSSDTITLSDGTVLNGTSWDTTGGPTRWYGAGLFSVPATGGNTIDYSSLLTDDPNAQGGNNANWVTISTGNLPVTPPIKQEDYKVNAQVNYVTTFRVNQNTGQLGVSQGAFVTAKTDDGSLKSVDQGGNSSGLTSDAILQEVARETGKSQSTNVTTNVIGSSNGYASITPVYVSGVDGSQTAIVSANGLTAVASNLSSNGNTYQGTGSAIKLSDKISLNMDGQSLAVTGSTLDTSGDTVTVNSSNNYNNVSLFAPFGTTGIPTLNIAQINGQVDNMTFATPSATAHTDGNWNVNTDVQYLDANPSHQQQAIKLIDGVMNMPVYTAQTGSTDTVASNQGMTVSRRDSTTRNAVSGNGFSISTGTQPITSSGNSLYVKKN